MKHLFTNNSAHFGKGAKFVEGTKDILGRYTGFADARPD